MFICISDDSRAHFWIKLLAPQSNQNIEQKYPTVDIIIQISQLSQMTVIIDSKTTSIRELHRTEKRIKTIQSNPNRTFPRLGALMTIPTFLGHCRALRELA